MECLEYRVGGLEIDLERIGPSRLGEEHKFVVEAIDNIASIYVTQTLGHQLVGEIFRLAKPRIIGGGSLYLLDDKLFLNNYSKDYGSISKVAAQKFAELIIPELEKQGVKPIGIVANPNEDYINNYWRNIDSNSK